MVSAVRKTKSFGLGERRKTKRQTGRKKERKKESKEGRKETKERNSLVCLNCSTVILNPDLYITVSNKQCKFYFSNKFSWHLRRHLLLVLTHTQIWSHIWWWHTQSDQMEMMYDCSESHSIITAWRHPASLWNYTGCLLHHFSQIDCASWVSVYFGWRVVQKVPEYIMSPFHHASSVQ